MNIFQSIKTRKPKLNKFDLSFEKKLSLRMGGLYPILLQEVVPGDKFRVKSEILMRMSPMIAPVMHRINVYTHYFFVPNRLVWNEWEDFITGGEDGLQEPVFPTMAMSTGTQASFIEGKLPDYFGVPPTSSITETVTISALPFKAYQMIYNEYFRDQNLEEKVVFDTNSGPVAGVSSIEELSTIRTRAWEKDYFTSALPWSQRGGEVALPTAISYKEKAEYYKSDGATPPVYTDATIGTPDLIDNSGTTNLADGGGTVGMQVRNIEGITSTINDLRRASRLQEWLEKSARGGSRYIEQILIHFGVRSSDARLQRPEYLGGGRSPMIISEVLQTSESDVAAADSSPQGNMAGHGISVGRKNGFSKSFEEHGFIIGILSVLPKTTYQQGLDRFWNKYDKFDYYWPEFAHLGEQEILNKEIFLDFVDPDVNDETFGYQQRYAEYKYNQSQVAGEFRSSLDFWTMGRIFTSLPPLNGDFVKSDPTTRIFAITEDVDTLYCQVYNKIDALRPMPYHSIPTL